MYFGEWKLNLKNGFGEFIWPDKRYFGFYVNDKKDGFGIYYWSKLNKVFIGFWKKGKQDGFGKFISKNKIKFGIWKMDKVDWFNSDEDAFLFLKNNDLERYNKFFKFNLDDVIEFFKKNDHEYDFDFYKE